MTKKQGARPEAENTPAPTPVPSPTQVADAQIVNKPEEGNVDISKLPVWTPDDQTIAVEAAPAPTPTSEQPKKTPKVSKGTVRTEGSEISAPVGRSAAPVREPRRTQLGSGAVRVDN